MNFIKQIHFTKQYDKRHESDQQMLQRVARKFGVLFFVILMFDTVLDFLMALIDIVFHLLHLIIEAIEYSLDLILGYIFHTNTHQSETIIVNGFIILTLYLTYRLTLALPNLYIRCERGCMAIGLRYIRREASCWRAMSLTHKIKWLSAHILGTACLLFFAF
ncbi:MAG: hypothetical protein GQ529_12830 [Methyloprofundus sp.]|nr:hypothetical protein [Methyloprofundus sp.]